MFNLVVSGSGGTATIFVEYKRRYHNTEMACQVQNMDFESIIFETTRGCEMGACGLLKNM